MHTTPETQQQQRERLRRHLGAILTDAQIDDIIKTVESDRAQLRTIQCPPIGALWDEQGGHYLGIIRGAAGQPDAHLILGQRAPQKLTHYRAHKFALACKELGFEDWVLPSRADGRLIAANARDLARGDWHWLEPQYASNDAYAWCQTFRDGHQCNHLKGNEFEVVLVRKVSIP